ncbi:hypothetical protein L6R46_04860 [Myxococcota bacterium]|nr:hypothetical protein [Myxococcota bacterium]
MRALLTLSAALFVVGCKSDNTIRALADVPGGDGLNIEGRVCDYDRNTWLEGARVYTHMITSDGWLADTVTTVTDAEGKFKLENVYDNTDYRVYVEEGNELLEIIEVSVTTQSVVMPDPDCGGGALNVAVVSGSYDDFEAVLDALGYGTYDLINGQTGEELQQFLLNSEGLAIYDVIFFNGGHLEEDLFYDTDGTDTAGVVPQVLASVKAYVQSGGVLYATDWAYDVIEQAWPGKIEFVGDDNVPNDAQMGETGTVTATVADAELKESMGQETFKVNYDLDVWPPITAKGEGTRVWASGDIQWRSGAQSQTLSSSPLLVSFQDGDGRVVYGTWRNASNLNTTGGALKAVKYLLERDL